MSEEKSGVSIRPKLDKYQGSVSASGSKSKICGDEVSLGLAGTTLEEAYDIASAMIGVPAGELAEKYKERNPGQRRMVIGNLIRGALGGKDEAEAAKAKAKFAKLATAAQKVVSRRQKEADDAKAKAKADRAKKMAEKAKKATKKPEAKPAKAKKAAAPKEPRKPSAKQAA